MSIDVGSSDTSATLAEETSDEAIERLLSASLRSLAQRDFLAPLLSFTQRNVLVCGGAVFFSQEVDDDDLVVGEGAVARPFSKELMCPLRR